MLARMALAPALAAGLLISVATPTLAAAPESAAQVRAFDSMPPKSSLATAIAATEGSSTGIVIGIRYESGTGGGTYLANLLLHQRLMSTKVGADLASVGPWTPLKQAAAARLKDERSAAEMLKPGDTTLVEAVVLAEQQAGGRAIDARMALKDGKPVYDIGVVKSAKLATMVVNPATGEIVASNKT